MIYFFYTQKDQTENRIKRWLLKEELDFLELPTASMTLPQLKGILSLCEDSFDDIIAYNSRAYQEMKRDVKNFVDLKLSNFLTLLLAHPKAFKNGILINFEKEQLAVGYNDDDIRTFVPRRKRDVARAMRGVNIYGYRGIGAAPVGNPRKTKKAS
ncbi:MAG: hypothetical protein LBI43_05560 [Streptococcaceae bacterium]|jgi:regulatory protein spx|nr:hypothetical protein [Streptococcaceae bacterium]